MSSDYDLIAMGDINLDWCARSPLSFSFSDLVSNGVIDWQPIDELPGGSGLNLARFAQEAGYRTLLLGKIGDDPAGRFVHAWLKERSLDQGVSIDPELGTGKAFIVRDTHDIRFLLNNEPNANSSLALPEVERFADALGSCALLHVSGYCLMKPTAPRTQATLQAMQLARQEPGPRVVFDVVPHQIYKIYDFSEFKSLTRDVDILIAEVATMRRYLGLGDRLETIDRQLATETGERLAEHFDCFVLRFGPSGCDDQLIWDRPRNAVQFRSTEHGLLSVKDKRGYGDRLTLDILKNVFHALPVPAVP